MKAPALPKLNLPKPDFKVLLEEFKTLDPKDPGLWPLFPRIVILAFAFIILLGCAFWFGWSPQLDELDTKAKEEVRLKEEWLDKKRQAVNIEEYRKQLVEIDRSFGAMLRQLPNKAEMVLVGVCSLTCSSRVSRRPKTFMQNCQSPSAYWETITISELLPETLPSFRVSLH